MIQSNRARLACISLFLILSSLLLLAACVPIKPDDPAPEVIAAQHRYPPGVEPLAEADAGIDGQKNGEEAAAENDTPQQGTLTVARRNINIRSGPGIDFQIVSHSVADDTFATTGKTENGWWRICCVVGPGDAPGAPTQTAWVSEIVVTADEAAEALPTLLPLFPDDLAASWHVQYECGSRRCAVSECAAVSRTEIHNSRDLRWLEINRIVTWEEACGEDSTWPHQIDRIEGTERYPNSAGLFFFNYWIGPRPGDANALFQLETGEKVEIWCSDEQEAEVTEENGWTTVYNGLTCYDVRTGMLVSMEYTKRWFFTGEFEGERYERAYFRDFEIYTVKLHQTNALLEVVDAKTVE